MGDREGAAKHACCSTPNRGRAPLAHDRGLAHRGTGSDRRRLCTGRGATPRQRTRRRPADHCRRAHHSCRRGGRQTGRHRRQRYGQRGHGWQPADEDARTAQGRFRVVTPRHFVEPACAAREPGARQGHHRHRHRRRPVRPGHRRYVRGPAVGQEQVDRRGRHHPPAGPYVRLQRPVPEHSQRPRIGRQAVRGAVLRRELGAHVPQGHLAEGGRDATGQADLGRRRRGR